MRSPGVKEAQRQIHRGLDARSVTQEAGVQAVLRIARAADWRYGSDPRRRSHDEGPSGARAGGAVGSGRHFGHPTRWENGSPRHVDGSA
jgi:hypothetical protein